MAKKRTTATAVKNKAGGRAPAGGSRSRGGGGSDGSGAGVVEPDASMRMVILHGKETFLRSLLTKKLQAALEERFGEVHVVRFDGASAASTAADVLDECRSFGLMQQHKMVVVDDADRFVNEGTRPLLERYAESPAEDATLVLRSEAWHAGKLDKAVAKVGAVVKCEAPTAARAMKWAQLRCQKEHGVALEADAAELLVERLGAELGRIDTELQKLAAGTEEGGSIGVEAVRELVGRTREEAAWELQAVLVGGSAEESLRTLANMIGPSRHDPVFLSFVFADLARKLHTVSRLLRDGTPPFQAARKAKIWGSGEQAIVAAARRADPERLADLLDSAVDADARMKSGRADAVRALEGLAIRFASV